MSARGTLRSKAHTERRRKPRGNQPETRRKRKRNTNDRTHARIEGLDTTEQADIANIRAMRSCGRTLQHIADALTERGVPTKTGRSSRWAHTAIRDTLTRR